MEHSNRAEQLRIVIERCVQTGNLSACIQTAQGRSQNANVLVNSATNYSQSGNSSQAIETLQEAININKQPTVIESPNEIIERQKPYTNLIIELWKKGHFEKAFAQAEEARTQAFRDQLQLAKVVITFRDQIEDSSLTNQIQELDSKIATVRKEIEDLYLIPEDKWWQYKTILNEKLNIKNQELDFLQKDYTDRLKQLQLKDPEVASLLPVVNDYETNETNLDLVLNAVQNLLDNDTTLVEYYVTDQMTLSWIITKNSFHAVKLEISQEDIVKAINSFKKTKNAEILQKLSSKLTAPLAPYLKTKTIGFIPHDVINNIPFAALTDGNKYLIDEYNLFILPSSSTLQFVKEKRKPAKDSILALGNPTVDGQPDLSSAQNEAPAIARLFGTNAFMRKAAKESVVWDKANSMEILHLAAHSEYNPNNPLFSLVYLAKDDKAEDSKGDGRLEAHEVFGLDLTSTTNLVVLSGCETQLSQVMPGSELTGLSRAFILAGSPSVVASLWKVTDNEATELLMTTFYKYLKEGKSKVEALRMAQMETQKQYNNPHDWAGFVLAGDPGN